MEYIRKQKDFQDKVRVIFQQLNKYGVVPNSRILFDAEAMI